MTEAAISFAGNLTEVPEVHYTEAGIARAVFRVAVSGRRDQEASFFTVVVWRDQAEDAAESLSKGSRVVVVGRLQQRSWTAEDGSARSTVEVVAGELGPGPGPNGFLFHSNQISTISTNLSQLWVRLASRRGAVPWPTCS